MTYLILSFPLKTPISTSHVHQRLTLRLTFPPFFSPPSLCLSHQSITELSVIFIGFFSCLFFQLSLWLRFPPPPQPTPQLSPPTTAAAAASCAPTPLRECVWSGPTIDRYIVPDRLDCATSQQTRVGVGGGGGRGCSGRAGVPRECLFFCFQFGPARGTPHSALSQTHHS